MPEETKRLPTREEIAPEHRWQLEDIYPEVVDWESDSRTVKEMLPELQEFQGHLGDDGATLLRFLTLRDACGQMLEKVAAYAHMRKDEDSSRSEAVSLADRAQHLAVEASTVLAFAEPELLALGEERIAALTQEEPGLALYRFAFEDLLRQKAHILSLAEESLLAQAGSVLEGPDTIFGMLNNVDLKFGTVRDEQGQTVELTKGRYITFLESRDRRVRQDAFETLYDAYGGMRHTLSSTLGSSVKGDVFVARARRYPSALEGALDADHVPAAVYTNLIATVRKHLPLLHRYFALRKRMLELSDLHMYDLHTPLAAGEPPRIPYPEAVRHVEEMAGVLGEEYSERVRRAFAAGWVDVYENRGKTSGAYSFGVYGVHPFMLLNHQDTLNDLFTLAHEMGHSMHSDYSHRTQPYAYAHYRIFVAEVASTCHESLLMHHLLERWTDRERRMFLLDHYLNQFRATLFRQTMFAEFEKITHEQAEAGEALTADALNQIYRDLNLAYHGPEVTLDGRIDLEWSRIPHFYRAFYVYKYATGFSAAMALSHQVRTQGEAARERYLRFLSAGGSNYPLELLKDAGVDMTGPEPIEEAMGIFAGLIDEMEKLA